MNISTNTKYEQHLENKKRFKELMPFLRGLDEEEMRILVHKVKNSFRDKEDVND